MYDFFKRRQDVIIILVLFIAAISLLMSNLHAKKSLNFVEEAVLFTIAPFQDALDYSVSNVSMAWKDYVNLAGVRKENRRLNEKMERLAYENNALSERLKSYKRLETLLDFPNLQNIPFVAARVIGRDTTSKVKVITINKGAKHGITIDMPVVTNKGLVGRITSVTHLASKALLISDVRSAVDAVVQETRDGLVIGGANMELLETRYLAVKAKVKNGQTVISSGMGGAFPKGLLIGFLEEVKGGGDGLFLDAKVRPAVDLNRLEEALVLKSVTAPPEPEDDKTELQ